MLMKLIFLLNFSLFVSFLACKTSESKKNRESDENGAEIASVTSESSFDNPIKGITGGLPYYSGYYTGSWSRGWKDNPNPRHEQNLDELAKLNVNLIIPYSTGLFDHRPELLADPQYIADHHLRVGRYLDKANRLGMKVIMQVWNSPHGKQAGPAGLSIDSPSYLTPGPNGTLALLKQLIETYKDHPAVIGWYVIDEPILSVEKAEDPAAQYQVLRTALDQVTATIRSADDTGKFLFGVFARWFDDHSKVASLKAKPRELMATYLDAWGQDQYPFSKKHTRDLENVLALQKTMHKLEGFNFNLGQVHGKEMPFLFVSQAQGFQAPGEGGINQRLPTIRESVFQKTYGSMIFADRRRDSFMGLLCNQACTVCRGWRMAKHPL